MTRAARFRQADITRALKAGAKAGVRVSIEIGPDGTMRITQAEKPEDKRTAATKRKEIVL